MRTTSPKIRPGIILAALCTLLLGTPASARQTARLSVASTGAQGNDFSKRPDLSADGSYVVFGSFASNFVPGDFNLTRDIFVKDTLTGAVERINLGLAGAEANGESKRPVISGDGRYVAYASDATNLVAVDLNLSKDVFLYDRVTGTTTMISVSTAGAQGFGDSTRPSISANGRLVAFRSRASLDARDTNLLDDVYLYDRVTATTTLVSFNLLGTAAGNLQSDRPAISSDGRFISYYTDASDIVPGDTNGFRDVVRYDVLAGTNTLVSISPTGVRGNGLSSRSAISSDGNLVAFTSDASNLIPGDANFTDDIFVKDMTTGALEIVSVDSAGVQANGPSGVPDMSADGRFIAFRSLASNLASGDTNLTEDVFVHDRVSGKTVVFSVSVTGFTGNGRSSRPAMTADGTVVAFESFATDLVSGDTNFVQDAFGRRDKRILRAVKITGRILRH